MRSAGEALHSIVRSYKRLQALEVHEAQLSTNKPWVSAQGGKTGKRGPSDHLPIDGEHPESHRSLFERKLINFATVGEKAVLVAEDELHGQLPARRSHPEWEARRAAVLRETHVPPVELAFLYGYASDKSVRELRIRAGKNEHSGLPLRDDERPLISTSRRVRK